MSRGETIGTLRAYFLIVAGINTVLDIGLLLPPIGVRTALGVGGLAIAGAFGFLGLRLPQLIAASPELCIRIVWSAAAGHIAMSLLAFGAYGSSASLVSAGFAVLLASYLSSNIRRLAGIDAGRTGGTIGTGRDGRSVGSLSSRYVAWFALGISGAGMMAILVLVVPFAIRSLAGGADSIEVMAVAVALGFPLILCALFAWVGLRMLRSSSPVVEAAVEEQAEQLGA